MHSRRRHAQRAAIDRDAAARAGARSVLVGLSPSWAQRQQGEVGLRDLVLADRAKITHPAARWWWGERPAADRGPAYCYLCEDYIASWDRRWPITDAARAAIAEHRDQVHPRGADPQGSVSPATIAGADHQKPQGG